MNYISGLINLIIGVVSIAVGYYGLHQYFGGDEKALHRLEKLKNEGQTTIANIDSMVLEVKIKRVTTYFLGYKFEASGEQFEGKYAFGNYNELDSISGLVTYLPSDPKISSLNIHGELAKAKREVAENKSSGFGLWLGTGLILFGLFNWFRAYRRFKGNVKPRNSLPPPIPPSPPKYPADSDFV